MDEISESPATAPRRPSIDSDEVAKFSAMAAEWWDPKGKFRPLHRFNPVRLGFIRETAVDHFRRAVLHVFSHCFSPKILPEDVLA